MKFSDPLFIYHNKSILFYSRVVLPCWILLIRIHQPIRRCYPE